MSDKGMVYIFTGYGKGKTSAALGTAIRGLANGWRVGWIALYKESSWKISEYDLPSLLQSKHAKNLEMKLLGKGFYIAQPETNLKVGSSNVKVASVNQAVVVDDDSLDTHRLAAQSALQEVEKMLARKRRRPQLLVLDEVCNAVNDGLIELASLVQLVESRGQTHIVLTGRDAHQQLIDIADLVSQVEKVKHPYDEGKLAVKGLDF